MHLKVRFLIDNPQKNYFITQLYAAFKSLNFSDISSNFSPRNSSTNAFYIILDLWNAPWKKAHDQMKDLRSLIANKEVLLKHFFKPYLTKESFFPWNMNYYPMEYTFRNSALN